MKSKIKFLTDICLTTLNYINIYLSFPLLFLHHQQAFFKQKKIHFGNEIELFFQPYLDLFKGMQNTTPHFKFSRSKLRQTNIRVTSLLLGKHLVHLLLRIPTNCCVPSQCCQILKLAPGLYLLKVAVRWAYSWMKICISKIFGFLFGWYTWGLIIWGGAYFRNLTIYHMPSRRKKLQVTYLKWFHEPF